jgi:hypothetical protein
MHSRSGLINGDFFNSIVAFSPGFVIRGDLHGQPRIFISHGTHDHILPNDGCGRRIAARLKEYGYHVTFREFDGDHEIPVDVAREGLSWVRKRGSVRSRRLTSVRCACNILKQKFFGCWSNRRFCWRRDHGTRFSCSRR